jgi:hypothetical protein
MKSIRFAAVAAFAIAINAAFLLTTHVHGAALQLPNVLSMI